MIFITFFNYSSNFPEENYVFDDLMEEEYLLLVEGKSKQTDIERNLPSIEAVHNNIKSIRSNLNNLITEEEALGMQI